jgi:hypothetical protein
MRTWNLPAASGRNRMSGVFEQEWTNDTGSTVLLSRIQLEGLFWPRSKEYKEKDLVVDYSVVLPQVLLRKESVESLIRHLEEWLDKPREIAIELGNCEGNDQRFHIAFAFSSDSTSILKKPACTIDYSGGIFAHGQWSFAVDQTCIGIFLRELQTSLFKLN